MTNEAVMRKVDKSVVPCTTSCVCCCNSRDSVCLCGGAGVADVHVIRLLHLEREEEGKTEKVSVRDLWAPSEATGHKKEVKGI